MLNRFFISICSLLLFLWSTPGNAQVKKVLLTSPNKTIYVSFSVFNEKLSYSISRVGQPVLEPSTFGLTMDGKESGPCRSLTVLNRSSKSMYYPTRGLHSSALDKYNRVVLKVNGWRSCDLEFKAFDDGIAFRYLFDVKGDHTVESEETAFCIPAGSRIWSQADIRYYEGRYHTQLIDSVAQGQLAGPPLTIKLPGNAGYAAITEGGLNDFAGMSLVYTGRRVFTANLSGASRKNGAFATPWRVILIGEGLNDLVNSDIISNVSAKPSSRIWGRSGTANWVKPGKCVWSWLAENGPVTFDNMKRFSGWAAELGFTYNLVDEGWAHWKTEGKDEWAMMKDLVDDATRQGVKIWVWKAYPDRDGIPGLKDKTARTAFFKKCHDIGIAGLKIDFFNAESQEVDAFYLDALQEAAKYRLMLDFHGANKPAGQSRTWPNEMTREGILGLEAGALGPKHNLTVLFTRMLAGAADFTPLSFSPAFAKGTTLSHQVGTVAAFTSPLMCLGVDPERLLKSEVKGMVQHIPVTWDETRVLPGSEIGQLAVMARRKGREWFLIVLNGENTQTVNIELDFLDKGSYMVNCLEDVPGDPVKAHPFNGSFTKNNRLNVAMSSGGGFVARFIPADVRIKLPKSR